MADYTQLSESQIEEVLHGYGLEPQAASHLDGGAANSSYHVITGNGGEYTLTVLDHAGNLSADLLVDLLQHVAQHGISTGEPVPNNAGSLLSSFDGHRIVLKRFVTGTCHDVPPAEHLSAAGSALAQVHGVPVPDWLPWGTRRLGDVDRQLAQIEDEEFTAWVIRHLEDVQPLFDLETQRCITHGDFFADNLVVREDGSIAVLDWETSSIDTATVDLGFAIVGLASVDGLFDIRRMHAFLNGYENERALSAAESALLRQSVVYAGVRSAYFRYVRHHIWFPDPAKFDLYQKMQRFVTSVTHSWVDH